MRPDMPRWTISVSPDERSARMYFDLRLSRRTVRPASRSAIRSGRGQRRSGLRTSAPAITAPSMTGASPRRTVSTSGNSGMRVPRPHPAVHCSHPKAAYKEGQFRMDTSPMAGNSTKTTHFGDREVPEDEKAGLVHGVFTSVASRYDVMNDLMSPGVHRIWKDAMMDWLAPRPGQRLLDVAGGTGDIAFRFLRRAPGAKAVVCDLTESMLAEGAARAEAQSLAGVIDWVVGDAMALPFGDASFDVYTISFGIRNVTRPEDALAEAYRVLRPGGRLMVLEFSQLPNPALQRAYDIYSYNVIPRIGQLVAGDRESYQYLVESIRKFPRSGAVCGDDRGGRLRSREVPQPVAGHRLPAFGLEALSAGPP